MSEPVGADDKPKVILPRCPWCATEPTKLSTIPVKLGLLKVVIIFCGNPECRRILSVQCLGSDEPMIVRPGVN